MILIILGIALAMFITGAVLFDKCDNDIVVGGLTITGGAVGVGAAIVAIVMLCCAIDGSVIDEKISLYEETNSQIETHINNIVADYKSYENDTYEKFDGSNGAEIVNLYPELKTNELIKEQMEVYYDNQKSILSLKSQKISLKPIRWWLYFGS